MSKLHNRSIDIALNILTALDASYVVTLPDGTRHTRGEVVGVKAKKERRRRPMRDNRKYGEMSAHYRPYLQPLIPGQITKVPCDRFKPAHLSSSLSAWACTNWGNGSVMVAASKEHIEVMRVK